MVLYILCLLKSCLVHMFVMFKLNMFSSPLEINGLLIQSKPIHKHTQLNSMGFTPRYVQDCSLMGQSYHGVTFHYHKWCSAAINGGPLPSTRAATMEMTSDALHGPMAHPGCIKAGKSVEGAGHGLGGGGLSGEGRDRADWRGWISGKSTHQILSQVFQPVLPPSSPHTYII